MASSGHFDPSQTYYGYKEVNSFDPTCTECLRKGKQRFQPYNSLPSKWHHCFVGKKLCQHPGAPISELRLYWYMTSSRQRDVARWTNVGGPIPICGRPIYSSSEIIVTRINSQSFVKRMRRIANSPTNPNAEVSDKLDGEEVEVVPKSIGHQSTTSTSQPVFRIFQIEVIPSAPRSIQPFLSTIESSIPPPSPNTSISRTALVSPVRLSPIQQPINSPMVTSQQLQAVASSIRIRED
ncbi:hypothetical protein O181_067946 [Austropuccinia psidii MF-1]|uniref:Uncharacterized protein n=1 Tax=Austropuccinia psidii MF-1 TaxID=1389203 RepID=A0A9Q3F0N9_9BASI|nr:hypothetical protein [Austropuccinia psidii MF-1]